jgi:hypothetical protein
MVEIHFKTFSPLAAASASVVITAQSAPTEVVRSQVVRRGAVIRGVLSAQSSPYHSSPQAAGSAGEWPATTAAPAKAGALTQLLSLCANPFRVSHRLPDLAQRWLQGRVHRSRRVRIVARFCQPRMLSSSQNGANESRATWAGRSRGRVSRANKSNALQQFADQRFFFL